MAKKKLYNWLQKQLKNRRPNTKYFNYGKKRHHIKNSSSISKRKPVDKKTTQKIKQT